MITNKLSLGFIKSPWHDQLYSITALMAWVTLSVIRITRLHWLIHPVHHMYHWASCNESSCHDHKYSILLGFIQWVTLSKRLYHWVSWTETPCHDHVYCITGLNGLSPLHHTVCITGLLELSPVHHTVCITGLRALSSPIQRRYQWASWTESFRYDHTYSIIRFHALGHRSPCKTIQKGFMYLVTLLWSHVQCTVSWTESPCPILADSITTLRLHNGFNFSVGPGKSRPSKVTS